MVTALHLDEVDSTNAEAMRRAAVGERGPLWITASRQTAGRGRAGRTWGTPEGNLAGTLLFAPACQPALLAGLSLVAGVAAYEAAAAALEKTGARTRLRIKWPNDLLLAGAKLSGILIESTVADGVPVVAIGIGLNVAVAPPVPDRTVTCLAEHGATADAGAVAATLVQALTDWIGVWDGGHGLAAVRSAWLERAGPAGEATTVNTGDGRVAGTFAGLDEDGALLLAGAAGVTRRITFGDVVVAGEDRAGAAPRT